MKPIQGHREVFMIDWLDSLTEDEKADYEAVLHLKTDVFKMKYPEIAKELSMILEKMRDTIGEDATIYALMSEMQHNRKQHMSN